MYNGIKIVVCNTDDDLANLYERPETFGFLINQYVLIKDKNDNVVDKKRWDGKELKSLSMKKIKEFKPKNFKQEFLCDLLCNKEIPIKIIAGVAGSGKSRLAIVHGLNFLQKDYSKLFIIRHNVGVGENNGYLKGDKFEKIRGWLGYLEDNLDDTQMTIEEMYDKGILDTDGVQYMKGRDLKDCWIMIDEAEDLTEDEFKMLGERVSEGSIVCFIGDYEQTTQEKYKKSSGLKRAIEKLAGNKYVGIVVFDDKENDNVRSDVSKVFTYLY